jgi:hypothetical protein
MHRTNGVKQRRLLQHVSAPQLCHSEEEPRQLCHSEEEHGIPSPSGHLHPCRPHAPLPAGLLGAAARFGLNGITR